MLPIERQQQILDWLEKEGPLKVSAISSRLGISEMTVYRDIQSLVEEQKVEKTSNGVALKTVVSTAADTCSYCFKKADTRLAFQLIKTNHQVEQACCAHCGLLRYRDIADEVAYIIGKDYLTDTTFNAKTGTFLMNAEIKLHCCEPQLIPFANSNQATRFQLGFGGESYPFEEAVESLAKEMGSGPCCSKKEI